MAEIGDRVEIEMCEREREREKKEREIRRERGREGFGEWFARLVKSCRLTSGKRFAALRGPRHP